MQMELLKQPLGNVLQDFIKEKDMMAREMERFGKMCRELTSNNEAEQEKLKIK